MNAPHAQVQVVPGRVLILTNQLHTGGAEIYVATVSRWLAERGAEVTVAAAPGEIVERLAADVAYYPVPLKDVRASFPLAAWRIRRILAAHQPDVILANSLATAAIARAADPTRSIPVVSVAHGWAAERYRWISRPLAVADRVIAVSHDVAGRLRRGGLAPSRIRVVPNGIDLAPFGPLPRRRRKAARNAMGLGPRELVAVNVGRFTEQKAQHHILEIAQRLAPDLPKLRFAIVGWGPQEEALRREIAARGLEDRVRLLLKRSDVPDLLRAADLYLSVSDWEGMPLSMIEAMAASLPIVTTETEGISALLPDGVAVRCPVGDVDALTEGVREVACSRARRKALGDAARSRAEDRFTKDHMCSALAAHLLDAMEPHA